MVHTLEQDANNLLHGGSNHETSAVILTPSPAANKWGSFFNEVCFPPLGTPLPIHLGQGLAVYNCEHSSGISQVSAPLLVINVHTNDAASCIQRACDSPSTFKSNFLNIRTNPPPPNNMMGGAFKGFGLKHFWGISYIRILFAPSVVQSGFWF